MSTVEPKLNAWHPIPRERDLRNESLRLDIARVAEQLERATNPNYRAVLERALAELKEQR